MRYRTENLRGGWGRGDQIVAVSAAWWTVFLNIIPSSNAIEYTLKQSHKALFAWPPDCLLESGKVRPLISLKRFDQKVILARAPLLPDFASQWAPFFPFLVWHFHSLLWWVDGKELWILCLFIACTEEVNGRAQAVMREGLHGTGLLLESLAEHIFQTQTRAQTHIHTGALYQIVYPLSHSFSSHFSFQNRGISHSEGMALKSSPRRWVCRHRNSTLFVPLRNKNLRTHRRRQDILPPA